MTDALNNKVSITLCGADRDMRASFKTMRNIEVTLKRPWAALGQMVAEGSYGIGDLAAIIHEGLLGNDDRRMSLDDVGEEILTQGMGAVIQPVIEFITMGFKGTKPVASGPKAEVEAAAP